MARPNWRRIGKLGLKVVLGVLMLVMVGRHVARTWLDLRARGESVHIAPSWAVGGAGLYLMGLCAFGAYFGRVVQAGATPSGMRPAIRAYLMSHLGKYVPGKALVVLMRVDLLAPYATRPATAAFATLYETLTMMAAGGLVAAVGFGLRHVPPIAVPVGFGRVVPVPLWPLGLGLGLAFWVVVEPRVFPRLSKLIALPFRNVGADALPRFSQRLLFEGLLWAALGWVLLGLSLVAVARAVAPRLIAVADWPLVIASVALATIAGFVVAVFPGGLVVREGVLMAALAPTLGTDRAVVSALALRLVWVLVEVVAAGVLTAVRPSLPLSKRAEP